LENIMRWRYGEEKMSFELESRTTGKTTTCWKWWIWWLGLRTTRWKHHNFLMDVINLLKVDMDRRHTTTSALMTINICKTYNKRTNDQQYLQDKVLRYRFQNFEHVLKWSMLLPTLSYAS
jgi:hypothetical protein